jgi:PhnB protein
MAKMNPYLNFDGTTEEAFNFYKSVFGGEFTGVHKIGEAPGTENMPEDERNRIMHIALPIDAHTTLMASDIIPSAGHKLDKGNTLRCRWKIHSGALTTAALPISMASAGW